MRVLFVCLGNICRSPIAEGVLRRLAADAGISVFVESAGTNQWHKGGPADLRSVKVCTENGVDISGHIARRFRPIDFAEYDRIFSLASDVTEEMGEFARTPADLKRIENFMDLLPGESGRSVPDPWYGGERDFQECYRLVEAGCRAVLPSLRDPKKNGALSKGSAND